MFLRAQKLSHIYLQKSSYEKQRDFGSGQHIVAPTEIQKPFKKRKLKSQKRRKPQKRSGSSPLAKKKTLATMHLTLHQKIFITSPQRVYRKQMSTDPPSPPLVMRHVLPTSPAPPPSLPHPSPNRNHNPIQVNANR